MSAFNHYARLKKILEQQPDGWYIVRIDKPTSVKNFKGDIVQYDHYYRLYTADGSPIRYGKFQQLSRLASVLGIDPFELPVVESHTAD